MKTCGKRFGDDVVIPSPIKDQSIVPYIPAYREEQLLADGDASTYLAFPSILRLSDERVLIAYKETTAHMDVDADLAIMVFNPITKTVMSKTVIDATVGEAAQDPELMKMPNGDLVIYLDVQRVDPADPKQRYGIKEIRSTDNGTTWKVRAADGTYKSVEDVAKHEYMRLTDAQGIIYGYTFDDVTVDGTVYMLAMSFPELAEYPGRSVHLIKSNDNGASWTHVKNLSVEFNLAFNESTLESYGNGFIINCRPDANNTPKSFFVDINGNMVTAFDYVGYQDLIKQTNRPKLFVEGGRYYLLGRNILNGTTTLCLYEIDPVTLAPLTYIELKDLPNRKYYHSFYAEYYLQTDSNGITYFNVITYDDSRNEGYPDIVRYEYRWEEILAQKPTSNLKTKETVFTINGVKGRSDGQAYIALPEDIPKGMKLPAIIAVHGSNRSALDYKHTAFYTEQKNIALSHGYIFAAISNDADTWGLDDGLYNLKLFYDYLIANYPVQKKVALWATSAGGTLANRMVKEYPDKVSFVLGTFPVYDLLSGFAHVNSCKTAWGADDLEIFQKLINGKNPAEFPDALKNHDFYIAHGSADAAVPIEENSQKMVADVGSNVHLEVIDGGFHGTGNYAFYGDIINQAFKDYPATYDYT